MASIINIPAILDERGALSPFSEALPFDTVRVYFIHSVPPGGSRGGHRHIKTRQALVCVSGSCEVRVKKGGRTWRFILDRNDRALVLEPEDWHEMDSFSADAVLLVAASTEYDSEDYICDPA